MEANKWDVWWENDWPLSGLPEGQSRGAEDPSVSIEETADRYVINTRLSEFQKNEINVVVDHGFLKVFCEHEDDRDGAGMKFGVKPCRCSLCRSFLLPEAVDVPRIRATVQDGWLKMEIPKSCGSTCRNLKVLVN